MPAAGVQPGTSGAKACKYTSQRGHQEVGMITGKKNERGITESLCSLTLVHVFLKLFVHAGPSE